MVQDLTITTVAQVVAVEQQMLEAALLASTATVVLEQDMCQILKDQTICTVQGVQAASIINGQLLDGLGIMQEDMVENVEMNRIIIQAGIQDQ
jgi:hypothetical protein